MSLDKSSKIYIAGHHGLVGSAIWNNLKARGYENLVGRSHKELDLTDQYAVEKFFDEEKPDAVVLAAAFVGGIMANSLYRADFIMQNMKMQCNVIENAYTHGVKKLLFLGSTCIYPKQAPQPMREDYGVGAFLVEEGLDSLLVGEVELAVGAAHQIVVAARLEIAPDGRAHEPAVPGDVYLGVLGECHRCVILQFLFPDIRRGSCVPWRRLPQRRPWPCRGLP